MRSGAVLAGCLALAARCLAPASAAAAEPVRVAIDWSQVQDDAVARCGLSRLRAGTMERLVEQGHAVVESVDGMGVAVHVWSSRDALHLRAGAGSTVQEDELRFEGCDATFVLEAIDRIAELVAGLAKAPPVAAPASPSVPGRHAAPDSIVARAFVDATGKLTAAGSVQGGGGIGGFATFPSGLRLGTRGELTGGAGSGVTVLELAAAITVAHHVAGSIFGLRAEAGPVLHLGTSDEKSVKEVDGLLGAGVELEAGPLFSQMLVYGRLRRFEHVRSGEGAFDTGHLGLMLRIGAQLSGS